MLNLLWRLVFWWKQRTGWIALERGVTATGTVVRVDPPGADGDGNFDLLLDEGQDRLITGFGGRLTSAPPVTIPSLHCEVERWAPNDLRRDFAALRPGDRVEVEGDHGFDGVHLGRSMLWEVIVALVRHQPRVDTGWFELHPVTAIRRLT